MVCVCFFFSCDEARVGHRPTLRPARVGWLRTAPCGGARVKSARVKRRSDRSHLYQFRYTYILNSADLLARLRSRREKKMGKDEEADEKEKKEKKEEKEHKENNETT